MKRAKAYLNLSRANPTRVKNKAKLIIVKMTDNFTFTAPTPSLEEVNTQIDVVNAKIAEQDAAFQTYQQKTIEVRTEADNLVNLLDTMSGYVENISNGDEAKILSAGFDIKQAPSPIGILDAPINLLAKEGHGNGEIICSWKTVKGAKAYEVEHSNDIADSNAWEHIQTVTKAKCTINGLVPGAKVWFRVAAIGAAGKSAYSDVTTRIVP